MLLTYSHEDFPECIQLDLKIHSMREDLTDRWKAGNSIQHWMHNPRNVSKNPYQFCKGEKDKCISTQKIQMVGNCYEFTDVRVDGRTLNQYEITTLAHNDGFVSVRNMCEWFFSKHGNKLQWFNGKIIHWTDYKY